MTLIWHEGAGGLRGHSVKHRNCKQQKRLTKIRIKTFLFFKTKRKWMNFLIHFAVVPFWWDFPGARSQTYPASRDLCTCLAQIAPAICQRSFPGIAAWIPNALDRPCRGCSATVRCTSRGTLSFASSGFLQALENAAMEEVEREALMRQVL